MKSHAPRITHSYTMLEKLIEDWSSISGKCLVYQHEADEDVKHTHCHLLLEECQIGEAGIIKRALKHIQLKGNNDWSFVQKDYNGDVEKYITYMTKGKYDPVYNKGYCPLYLEECKKKWVDYPVLNSKKVKQEPIDKKETVLIQQWLDFKSECMPTGNYSKHLELKDFRGVAIAYWRKRNKGLMPTASTYKRFLVSLYLEYCEMANKPLTEQVIDEVDQRM